MTTSVGENMFEQIINKCIWTAITWISRYRIYANRCQLLFSLLLLMLLPYFLFQLNFFAFSFSLIFGLVLWSIYNTRTQQQQQTNSQFLGMTTSKCLDWVCVFFLHTPNRMHRRRHKTTTYVPKQIRFVRDINFARKQNKKKYIAHKRKMHIKNKEKSRAPRDRVRATTTNTNEWTIPVLAYNNIYNTYRLIWMSLLLLLLLVCVAVVAAAVVDSSICKWITTTEKLIHPFVVVLRFTFLSFIFSVSICYDAHTSPSACICHFSCCYYSKIPQFFLNCFLSFFSLSHTHTHTLVVHLLAQIHVALSRRIYFSAIFVIFFVFIVVVVAVVVVVVVVVVIVTADQIAWTQREMIGVCMFHFPLAIYGQGTNNQAIEIPKGIDVVCVFFLKLYF